MKLLLAIFCLINGGIEVVGQKYDVKDMTAPEDLIPKEDLDEFNQIRKDIYKSISDIRSQMESEESQKYIDSYMRFLNTISELKPYEVTTKEELQNNVEKIYNSLDQIHEATGCDMDSDSDKKKCTDLIQQANTEYENRLQPIMDKYSE